MDYLQGSTSGSGEVTAEVVYVGYGIRAPELGFDEYAGLDVKGKIVLSNEQVASLNGSENTRKCLRLVKREYLRT